MSFRVALLSILVICVPVVAKAQVVKSAHKTTFSIDSPNAPAFNREGRNLTVLDPKQNRLLYWSSNQLWQFDMENHLWLKVADLTVPEYLTDVFIDTADSELIFVSGGVGEVHTLKIDTGDYQLKRMNDSFRHLNQFGSSKFYNKETGEIFAFGGYGFWYFKNLITYYNQDLAEWNLVPLDEASEAPPERSGALSAFWPEQNQLYILGGSGVPGGRQRNSGADADRYFDFWSFSFATHSWNKIGRLNHPSLFTSDRLTSNASINPSGFQTLDKHNGFWFFPANDASTKLRNRLFVADLSSGDIAKFPPVLEIDTNLEDIFSLYWNNETQKLCVLTNTVKSQGRYFPISFYSFELESPKVIKDHIKESNITIRSNDSAFSKRIISIDSKLLFGVLVGIVFSILSVVIWVNYFKPKHPGILFGQNPSLRVVSLNEGKLEVYLNDYPLHTSLGEKHLELLVLLAKQREQGNPFISSDLIDEKIWNHKLNQDYLRKERSSKINDVNKLIEMSPAPFKKLVIKRKSPDDKRRSEYAINPEINIEFSD